MDQGTIQVIRNILEKSSYTVAMCGTDMMKESGMPSLRDPEIAYEVEMKYGYSPEEIFSASFYSTRKDTFFDYYREEMLKKPLEPSQGFYALAELEKRGLVQCEIANNVHNLTGRAGCKNVLNLHGTIDDNQCPRCGKKFPMEFIRDSEKTPLCPDCLVPVKPQVLLFGEMLGNRLMTKAVEEISKADVLLLLGTNLHSGLCEEYVPYFRGNTMIIISRNEHFSDDKAQIVIHEPVKEVLPQIVWGE